MQIGNRIKFMRESRGWSQVQLVNEARKYIPEGKVLARETMSRIENGHRPPDLWVLSAIAQALGLTPGEILDGVEAGPPAPSPLRQNLAAPLNALLDALLTAFEGVGLSENERELLRYLREASPEKREAIHRLIVAEMAEAAGPDAAGAGAQAASRSAD
ncbi:MAG: Helix-turn-helix domain protein [Chloroflexi bacterium ADurb.Bin325]|nr:MAG: Helix-turn-helix domain protein [Chloroflexi bacterium ADurb.Bin325]